MPHLKPLAILIAVSGGTLSADDTALAGDAEAAAKCFANARLATVLWKARTALGTDEVQDPEPGGLQFFTQAARIVIDLV